MKDCVLDYGNLIEQWKVDLIVQRARHFGVPEQDWPDIQQSIILEVLKFKYDPHNPQGAEERTALTSLIDNRIIDLLRKQGNQDRGRHIYLDMKGLKPTVESLSYLQNNAFHCDLDTAIASLSKMERAAYLGLMQGYSIRQIAASLRCRQERIARIVQNVRKIFSKMGVDKWR